MPEAVTGHTISDSLLWVDGNTNDTSVQIPAGVTCTYNVNQPVFWTPMSVISGLASGFCERRAILNPTFSGVAWNDQNSATIVSRCAKGLALGSEGDALFNAANDATFHYPITGTTNYMTAMDAAITTLVTGTTYFVTAAGQQYKTNNDVFSGLAVAARTRAGNEAGSSIQLPTSDGWFFREEMLPAYPVEWAKERKWMLDELRYTGGIVVTGTSVSTLTAQRISGSATTDTSFTSRGTTSESGSFIIGLVDLSGKANQMKVGDITYRLTGILPGQTAADQKVTLYLDPHAAALEDSPRYIDYGSLTRVVDVQQASDGQSYHVEYGGVLNFTGTQAVSAATVVIDAGGVVNMQNKQARISDLSEMPGCTFNPYVSGATVYVPTINAIAYRFTVPDAEWRTSAGTDGSCTYYNADAIITDSAFRAASSAYDSNPSAQNAAASAAASAALKFSGKMWVCSGATVQLYTHENSNVAYVSNGTVALSSSTNTDSWGRLYQCVVDNAGSLVINSGTYVEMTAVRSGGTAIVYGGTIFRCLVEPGGTLHLAGDCTAAWLSFYDGATFNAYSGDAETPGAITVTWTGSDKIIAFHHFCTFNLFGNAENITVDTKMGWTDPPLVCTPIADPDIDNLYYIAGAETASAGKDVITAYMTSGLASASERITGKVKFGSTTNASTYNNPESGCKAMWPTYTSVYYGAAITAKNRRPDISQSVNHYLDFRVRQWSTDHE